MSSKVDALPSGGEPGEQISKELFPKMKDTDSASQVTQVASDSGNHVSTDEKVKPSSIIPEKPLQDGAAHASQLHKEGSISSMSTGKIQQTPGRGSDVLHSGLEGRSPVIREKVSEDGYNWRKYGQKFVRGNEFIRSYYRCTHPTCPVKKQLERSHGGNIEDIVYFGDHDHPKPQGNVPVAVGFVLSVVEERPEKPLQITAKENATPPSVDISNNSRISSVASSEYVKGVQSKSSKTKDDVSNDDPFSKRQKKTNCNADHNPEDKSTGESRVVVQTLSEVDMVNDGYRWRKYGQKMVKGNPNPRSYYRCSCPGCPAKKHVERASHDPKVVVTSYEGQHDHDDPPSRTVMANPIRPGIQNDDSETVNLVVSDSPHPERKLQDQLDGRSGSKLTGNDVSGIGGVLPTLGVENKPDRQQNGKPTAKEENEGDAVVSIGSASARLEKKGNGNSISEAKDNGAAFSVRTITPNKQHVSSTGPVTS